MQNPPNPPNYAPGNAPGGGAGKSSTGMDANVAALIAYVLTWLTGLIFFLIEKESRFVRFHAMQAILLGVGIVVLYFALMIFQFVLLAVSDTLGLLFSFLWLIVPLAIIGLIVLCCVKAYQGQMFKLPLIGDMAERFSAR